ncbi:MAG: family 20 glycosylhydrolase [Verrucomicrobiota bacterium]
MLRAFQWDLARQVERLDWLLTQLPRYAAWGYYELYLHLEDAVVFPSLPGVARADAYSRRDFGRLVDAATRAGIRVVPIVNLLGHTQYLIKSPELRDLNELRAVDGSPLAHGQICPLHPRTLEVAEKLLRDLAPFCTAGKVHVGLDESFHLGKCPRCRAEVARHGLAAHFAGYATRLHGLAATLGLRTGLWADMLALLPDAIPLLPRGLIAYDWYYYPFTRHPRLELRNFSEYDLVPALRAQGIEHWGCPMNGAFRHEPLPVFGERLANIVSWWQRGRRTGATGMLITSWEPSRLAQEMTTVVDAAAASLWLNPEADDATAMLARGFARTFGLAPAAARDTARAALRCDEHAFAGYARWEINDRWNGCAAPNENIARHAQSVRFFTRLARRKKLPPPFAASVAVLRCLATRDVFVRETARNILRHRRLLGKKGKEKEYAALLETMRSSAGDFAKELRRGRAAARAMWRRTRDPRAVSPNEIILAISLAWLRGWQQEWLAAIRHRHKFARLGVRMPGNHGYFCGRWQLSFTVHNFAPALQQVVVEEQLPDGNGLKLRARFAIEFRAAAARPRANIRRLFSVPVNNPDDQLRIAVRGLGRIGIENVTLTDGVVTLRPRGPSRFTLGRPAPKRGWPEFSLDRNADERVLAFGKT